MDRWKVAVLGDGAVGKTALTTQTHDPTVQDTYSKQVKVDNEKCRLEVIDTAAPEKYPTLQNDCFLGSWLMPVHGICWHMSRFGHKFIDISKALISHIYTASPKSIDFGGPEHVYK
ncbi:hypothetical protein K435DRAFT_810033 [Dendrothele bispora CBS 962.96]|uniref:P-loop containing nucleoside triphosphate hydrolase protein n=1 Tax=Dendrothele bispora (strain CBS 962.96) TaxID=1314807 RepID=A0A4S8KWC9_DENBC|nr:hypothetical protein K435DRAFT_810033 [Dendrothele bispora CBS 962.96]